MLNLQRIVSMSACAALAVLVLGCGPGGPKLYPVKGTLKIAGSPAKDVQVTLHPVEPIDNPIGAGNVTESGSFEILSGVEGDRGLPTGKYKVVLKQMASAMPDREKQEKDAAAGGPSSSGSTSPPVPAPSFHSKYLSITTTPEEVEIVDKSVTLNLDVEGPEASGN